MWLRLTATEPGTCRIAADREAIDSGLCTPAIPTRSPALVEGDSLAYFTYRRRRRGRGAGRDRSRPTRRPARQPDLRRDPGLGRKPGSPPDDHRLPGGCISRATHHQHHHQAALLPDHRVLTAREYLAGVDT